jgi:hypothetical protein
MTEIDGDTQVYRKVIMSQMQMQEDGGEAAILLLPTMISSLPLRMRAPWSHPGADIPQSLADGLVDAVSGCREYL